jgi:diguanylate cyclase (GGDEF)-like protein/PAS domain S-box-containing protein
LPGLKFFAVAADQTNMSRSGAPISNDQLFIQLIGGLQNYAVILLDPEGHVISWNRGAQSIKGWSAGEIIGQHFDTFYTPEARDLGHPDRELMAAAAMGRYEEEGWRVRKDGTRFWASIVITALLDEDGDVAGYGKVTRDMTAQKQAEDQNVNVLRLLETTARTDFLTGLSNRRSLDETMAREMSTAARHLRPLTVAMIDLDLFKRYNDEHGHAAGDRFLKQTSVAWSLVLRQGDVLARYGGEEFTLVLPETTLEQAEAILERLRKVTPKPLTCSIGVAEWDGTERSSELISRADQSLLAAKKAGRNQVVALPLRAARGRRFQRDPAASRSEQLAQGVQESFVLPRGAEADPDVTGTA